MAGAATLESTARGSSFALAHWITELCLEVMNAGKISVRGPPALAHSTEVQHIALCCFSTPKCSSLPGRCKEVAMSVELLSGMTNVVRFPVERRARPTLELLRGIAPDVREVMNVAEAFGMERPLPDL